MSYRQPFTGDYQITQRFGETVTNPAGHTGIDYGCPTGTKVLASNDGIVVFAGYDRSGYGNLISIRHNDGYLTLYGHLSLISVAAGQHVRQGEKIGESGNTGNSTGAHLHFEMRGLDGKPIDPATKLMNMYDAAPAAKRLKEPADLGEHVTVVAQNGAKVFNPDWSMKYYGFPQGTELHFTGKTEKRPGFPNFTYCEVYEEPRKYFVAIHDGDTQILDNRE